MQLWRLESPLAALDVRCWTGASRSVPLPRATRTCLARFAAANATALAAEYGMVNVNFAAGLIERSQVALSPCPGMIYRVRFRWVCRLVGSHDCLQFVALAVRGHGAALLCCPHEDCTCMCIYCIP